MLDNRLRAVAATAISSVFLAVSLAGCPEKEPETEETLRKREADALDARVHAWKVTLYRALKTSIRALPPPDVVERLVHGRQELTRDEWVALLESDPALAVYEDRVGFFVVGAQLREAGRASALAAIGAVTSSAPEAPAFTLPRTAHPFGSAAVFYGECKSLLEDDEDRYPTITVSMLPGELGKAAREGTGDFAKPPLDRVPVKAVEHAVLGCAWLAVEPDLALYELTRARPDELLPLEELVLRAARSGLLAKQGFPYLALEELAELEKKSGPIARELGANGLQVEDGEATVSGLVHLGRVEVYSSIGKKDEAARELALAEARLKGAQHLRVALHVFAAKAHVDRNEFRKAADELRIAADAFRDDVKKQEELRALVERIEKELPDSLGPLDVARWVLRLVEADVRERALPRASAAASERFRAATQEQVAELEKAFPSREDLGAKAAKAWRNLRGAAASVASRSR